MSLSKESINEFKEIYKKEYGKELSNQEAYESATNLMGFVEVLYECAAKEAEKKRRLKKEPEGFHVTDGIYNCLICHRQVTGDESWYDRWGCKCLLCQKAVKEGIVPGFVCKDSDSWYAMWQLQSKFGIKHQTAKKMVRQEKLKARIVPYENGDPYEYVFLKKENPNLIDPERKSPARKSYDKHYNEITDEMIRKEKKKILSKRKS